MRMAAKEYKKLKTRSRRRSPERDLQIQCVRRHWIQYPKILLHHSPNGGKRNKFEAEKFRLMGTRSGFPDIFIVVAKRGYHGLFIEMKTDTGSLTKNQKEVHELMKSEGYYVVVAKSFEEFCMIEDWYLGEEK